MYSSNILRHLGNWAPGQLGTWALGHLGTWALILPLTQRSLNTQKHRETVAKGISAFINF